MADCHSCLTRFDMYEVFCLKHFTTAAHLPWIWACPVFCYTSLPFSQLLPKSRNCGHGRVSERGIRDTESGTSSVAQVNNLEEFRAAMRGFGEPAAQRMQGRLVPLKAKIQVPLEPAKLQSFA